MSYSIYNASGKPNPMFTKWQHLRNQTQHNGYVSTEDIPAPERHRNIKTPELRGLQLQFSFDPTPENCEKAARALERVFGEDKVKSTHGDWLSFGGEDIDFKCLMLKAGTDVAGYLEANPQIRGRELVINLPVTLDKRDKKNKDKEIPGLRDTGTTWVAMFMWKALVAEGVTGIGQAPCPVDSRIFPTDLGVRVPVTYTSDSIRNGSPNPLKGTSLEHCSVVSRDFVTVGLPEAASDNLFRYQAQQNPVHYPQEQERFAKDEQEFEFFLKIVKIIYDDHYWKLKHRKGDQLPDGIKKLRSKVKADWLGNLDCSTAEKRLALYQKAKKDFSLLVSAASNFPSEKLTRHADTQAFYNVLTNSFWNWSSLGAKDKNWKAEYVDRIHQWPLARSVQVSKSTQKILSIIQSEYWNDKSSQHGVPRGIHKLRDLAKKYSFEDGTFDARFEKEFLAQAKKVGASRDKVRFFHPSRTDAGRELYQLLRNAKDIDSRVSAIEAKMGKNPPKDEFTVPLIKD